MTQRKFNYYPPTQPQFYFEKGHFAEFSRFYKPYSIKAKIFWSLYKNVSIFRNYFTINETEIKLPVGEIKNLLDINDAVYFFNLGTLGKEQKASIVAYNNNERKFLKFGQSPIANNLITNEAQTLKKINNLSIKSPKIIKSGTVNGNAFLVTELLTAKKANAQKMDQKILQLLIQVARLFDPKKNGNLKTFSHGDFCPWNILQNDSNELLLIDWEKAEFNLLGYDLFTYIFQTNFLIYPNKPCKNILNENLEFINKFFNEFNENDYKEFLLLFIRQKIEFYIKNNDRTFLNKYNELLKYAE